MALTGIAIFKMLPKTNCKECGVPTCLAFAMALAAGKAELSACPYVSDEAKEKLAEASAPPIRPLSIGTGEDALKIGGETVSFRHEKRFENPTGLGVMVKDTMEESEVDARVQKLKKFQYERVGLNLKADLLVLNNESGDGSKFEALVNKVKGETGFAMVLMSENPDNLEKAVEACDDKKPLIYAATKDSAEKLGNLAKEKNCPVAAKAANLEELADLTTKLTEMGVKDIVIDSGARSIGKVYEDQIVIRRAALEKKFKPLGFPTITFPCEMTDNLMKETLITSALIAKYAGIAVMSDFEGHSLFPLLVERMNIFTDPQKPMATTQGIYPINEPSEDSPILITTNFALTYFIVSGEVESSRVPSWLLVMDTEGLSVMTAWAAGKFVGDAIAIFIKKCGIIDKVKNKKIIIPGYAANISGDLEEELGDWEVKIGPRDASHIPAFLKSGM